MSNPRLALTSLSMLAAIASLTIFISRPPRVAHAQNCGPAEHSYTIDTDSCGGADWELVADYGGVEYDEGEWSAAGDCATHYTDCNCNYYEVGNYDATRSDLIPEDDGPDGSGGEWYTWWWNLYGYNGWNEPACTSGPCQGSDYVQYADAVQDNFYQAGWDQEDGACVF